MSTGPADRIDVHQHLWPERLLAALRERAEPPFLRGWTLHTATEPPFAVRPDDHDPARRARLDAGTEVLVSLSTPLGIEALAPDQAQPLLDAWHAGARELPAGFGAWAAAGETEPDLQGLRQLLARGFVGLQVSATAMRTPSALEALAPVLAACEEAGRPVLVHPGPVAAPAPDDPPWWPAVVGYPAQLQAAWWSWQAIGRSLLPRLRICFAAAAGLAPLHRERAAARGAGTIANDGNVFVDTSSYGRAALTPLIDVLGGGAVVLGSDRPYAQPTDDQLDDAMRTAVTVTNPRRLLAR